MGLHRFFRGDRTQCARLYPFALRKLEEMRVFVERAGMRSFTRKYDTQQGDMIRVTKDGPEETIEIHAGEWKYVSMGWGNDVFSLHMGKTIGALPRVVQAMEGAYSREHLLRGDRYAWYAAPGEEQINVERVGRSGKPIGALGFSPGGVSFLTDGQRSMYATLSEEVLFSFGPQHFGTYFWGDLDNQYEYFETRDNGETVQYFSLGAIIDKRPDQWYVGAVGRDTLYALKRGHEGTSDEGETKVTVQRGISPVTSATLIHGEAVGGAPTLHTLIPWQGWGVTPSYAQLIDWSRIFAQTVTFYTMSDRVLMVAFVVTFEEDTYAGYWRAFVSTDSGESWTPGGAIAAGPQDSQGRTIVTDPGFFRRPVVLPDNRVLAIQAGGLVMLADSDASTFSQIATFPVADTNRLGVPSPVIADGVFRVTVTALVDGRVVVYANADDTYMTWEIVGTIEDMVEPPDTSAPALYPFTRVLGIQDPINPAFPRAFEEQS